MTKEEEKTRADLVAHLNHAPFEAFVIRFVDGSKFDIVRRFQAGVGLTKGLVVSDDSTRHKNFRLRDIQSIESLVVA
jgi:hypothetical protein